LLPVISSKAVPERFFAAFGAAPANTNNQYIVKAAQVL